MASHREVLFVRESLASPARVGVFVGLRHMLVCHDLEAAMELGVEHRFEVDDVISCSTRRPGTPHVLLDGAIEEA
eukprot:7378442-Prymnesium_polylepis.1